MSEKVKTITLGTPVETGYDRVEKLHVFDFGRGVEYQSAGVMSGRTMEARLKRDEVVKLLAKGSSQGKPNRLGG